MNRRQYIRVAAGVPIAVLTAGCAGNGTTNGGGDGGMTETVVVAVGEGDGGGAEPPATESDVEAIEITTAEFERIDENEFVVRGAVENVGDQPIDHIELDVRLYEQSGGEEGFFDEALRQREFEFLDTGQEWDFRIRFDDVEIGSVEQFSISATVTLATPTP